MLSPWLYWGPLVGAGRGCIGAVAELFGVWGLGKGYVV